MRHTPGPWTVDLETGEIDAGNMILGTIYGADEYSCCEEDIDEECKANARLVAAAPDLLEALEMLYPALNPDEFGRLAEQARKAILKARGEGEMDHFYPWGRLDECGRCHAPLLSDEAELCWYCTGPLCFDCWENVGHCGHAEAVRINEAARAHHEAWKQEQKGKS